jgi:phosphohistidine swiveling domain-containing protein
VTGFNENNFCILHRLKRVKHSMGYIVALHEARDEGRFGAKAVHLASLGLIPGVRVPAGFAVEATAFHDTLATVLSRDEWPANILNHGTVAHAVRLEEIRQRLLAATLPESLVHELRLACNRLGDVSLAVRSSALHEDTHNTSAAGLHETVLGVRSFEAVCAAVLRCYASIYHERAMAYLVRLPLASRRRASVALVVQRMVRADAAGVLFTADPVSGDRSIMTIESAWGIGSSVVDGGISPDVFQLERVSGKIRARQIGDKPYAVRDTQDGTVTRVALSAQTRTLPSLDDAQIRSLHTLGDVIEHNAGAPRDVEWAFEDGVLWALQSRPIVEPAARKPVTPGATLDDPSTWIWSNVNVGEALPGVATPLTWSIAAAFSDLGFRRAFGALGCDVPSGLQLVGNFHGRIYLNLTNFMRVARQVPLLGARTLIEFGGGGGADEIERQVPPGSWLPFLVKLPATGLRFVAENTGLDARIDRFESDFVRERQHIQTLQFSSLSHAELDELFATLLGVLDRTGAIMLTCASGYLSSIVGLRIALRTLVGNDADRFERELLSGITDLESAAPGITLVHIAEIARNDAPARDILLHHDPNELTLDSLPEGPTRRAFASLLRAHGYRCPREAELATPRWREAPGTLFAALRSYLTQTDDSPLRRVDRQSQTRTEAEAELLRRTTPVARALTRHALQRAWRFARLRERMRARVTEVLGFFRMAALEASRRMADVSPQCGTDAAFFLSIDEVRAWLRGQLGEVAPVIAARRAQVARDRARPDPPATFVGSPPAATVPNISMGDRWNGVAASPGVVTGVVRVLRDPVDGASLKPGEVLVTSVADVGWTPFFLTAAAVVTELGGALSHAALVAREYGVPAVVNVSGVTRALRTGDRVRVNGDQGTVERLPNEIPKMPLHHRPAQDN